MQCANCTSTVIDQKDGISLLSRVSTSASIGDDPEEESQERVTVIEALADMIGQHEVIGKLLADVDVEEKAPVLCSVCFDFVHRSHEARRGFLFKCEKDGLINSVLSLVIKEERIEDDELEIDDGSHRSVNDVPENSNGPCSKVNVTEAFSDSSALENARLNARFGLKDCRVLLIRLDQVKVKVEVDDDIDSTFLDEDEDCDFLDNESSEQPELMDTDDIDHLLSTESHVQIPQLGNGHGIATESDIDPSQSFGDVAVHDQVQKTPQLDTDHVKPETSSSTRTLRQKYKCKHCAKIFPNAFRLEAHARDHEEEQVDKVEDLGSASDSFHDSEGSEFEDGVNEQSDDGSGMNEELDEVDQKHQHQKKFDTNKSQCRKRKHTKGSNVDVNSTDIDLDSTSPTQLFRCKAPDCEFVCPDAKTLEMHVEDSHVKNGETNMFGKRACLCDGCGFVAQNFNSLLLHKKRNCKGNKGTFYDNDKASKGKKYRCQTNRCRKTFSFVAERLVHTSMNHYKDGFIFQKGVKNHRMYRCCRKECEFICNSVEVLTEHMFEHTKETSRFKCSFPNCEYVATTIENMTEHWRSHKDTTESNLRPQFITNVYTCRKCGQVFRELHVLRRHIARIHGKRRWECSFENCGRIFKFQKGLEKHEFQHDPSDIRMPVDDSVSDDGNGVADELEINSPIVCDTWTWYADSKLKHLFKFHCPKCSKTFRFKASLLSHIRDNHLEDLDKGKGICPLRNCTYRGYSSKGFAQHVSLYTKELIYTCQVCEYTTKLSECLKSHRKRCHSQLPVISDSDIVKDVTADNTLAVGPQSSEIKRYLYCGIAHCDFRCGTEEEWENHKDCGREIYACSNATSGCKFLACSEEAKKRHEQLKHSSNTIFCKAPHCKFLCENEDALEEHVKEAHVDDLFRGPAPTLCDLCGKIFESEGRLGHHKKYCEARVLVGKGYIEMQGTQTFNCDICPEQFSYKAFLRAHKLKKHDTENRSAVNNEGSIILYKCDHPRCTFQGDENELNDHCFAHTWERRFQCTIPNCNFVTGTLTRITQHTGKHATEVRTSSSSVTPTLEQCPVDFDVTKAISTSNNSYHNQQCPVCGKACNSKLKLKLHAVKEHPGSAFLRTLDNEFSKSKKDTAIGLLYDRIVPTERFSCEKCNKTFNYNSTQLVHSWIDHPSETDRYESENQPKMFSCGICKYTSTTRSALNGHVLRVHTVEKQYRCKKPNCGYECIEARLMRKHVKNPNHKRNSRNAIPPRKLQCNVCQKFFFSNFLKRHVANKHNDVERPFKCTQCPFATAYACSLKTHIKFQHQTPEDNLELFSCTLCTYNTMWKGALVDHMRDAHGLNSASSKRKRKRSKPRVNRTEPIQNTQESVEISLTPQ